MYKLTPKQIEDLDNITAARRSHEETLKIAMNFHSNRRELTIADEREWWDEIARIHGFDLHSQEWKIERDNFQVVVKPVNTKEEE